MKKFIPILFLLFGLLSFRHANATHVMGSDITYECLGNGLYKLRLTVYRDCNGVQLSNTPMNIKCASGSGSITPNMTKISVKDVTGLGSNCPTQSRCSGSYAYGIEEHIWEGTVNLNSLNCCEVVVSWEQCCRNSNISTGAADQNFYTSARINKCVTPCNSSPKFTSPPAALICVGQDFVFNNGASDTLDVGDSLSYKLVNPLSAEGTAIGYSGSWSAQRPISFLGFPNAGLGFPAGFRLDSVTGDLSFRPTKQNEVTVMVIEVTEWRTINGTPTIVGVTRRDMQIIVTPCPDNKVPKISGQSQTACSGQQVCVTVTTDDADTDDTVRISWNRGIPRATFSNNNGATKRAGGSVCWTPAESDVSNIPYTFTITAKDDACPRPGQAIRSFSITVRESPKGTIQHTKLTCGKVAIDYTPAKNNYPGLTHTWSVRDSTGATIATSTKKRDTIRMQPGRNRLFLTLRTSTPCVNAFVDTIMIDPFVQLKLPKDTFICAGNPMTLKAVTKDGVPAFRYKWSTGDTLDEVTINPGVDSSFWAAVYDAAGCDNSDTIKVLWKPLPKVNNMPDARICYDQIHTFDGGNDSTNLRYLWSNGDTSRYIYVSDSNQYRLRITDSIGCHNFDTATLFVNTVPVDAGPNTSVCDKDTAVLNATGADSYQWFVAPNLTTPVAAGASYSYVVTADRYIYVKAVRTFAGLTCTNTDSVTITRDALPDITFGTLAPRCVNSTPVNLISEGLAWPTLTTGSFESISTPASVSSNFFYPDVAGAGANNTPLKHTLRYTVTDAKGCTNSKNTDITVNPLPVAQAIDGSYCGYDGVKPMNPHMSTPTSQVLGAKTWRALDAAAQTALVQQGLLGFTFNVSQVPQNRTYQMELRVTSSQTGCINYDTANITVREIPVVEAGFVAPLCQTATTIDLEAPQYGAAPAGGTWSQPAGGIGLENGRFFNPDLPDSNWSKSKIYYTYDIPGNNCPVTDSVEITVKPRPDVRMGNPGTVCVDTGVLQLSSFGTPLGGIWSGDGGVSAGGLFNATAAGAGSYNLKYQYTDFGTGCSWEATGQITIQEKPTLTVVVPKAACEGATFDLSATYTIANGLLWTTQGDGLFDGNATSTAGAPKYVPGPSDNSGKQFTFNVQTTGNGVCKAEVRQYNVEIFAFPKADIQAAPLTGCEPHNVNFNAITDQTPVTYDWNFGDPGSTSNTGTNAKEEHEYKKFGTYTATLKIVNTQTGCERQALPVNIVVHATPNANFKMSREVTTVAATDITFTDMSTIGQGTISTYEWELGDPMNTKSSLKNPVFEYPTDTGKYIITQTITSDMGCESVHIDTLTINPDITVFVPNAFTPNKYGPERNNRFYVTAEGFLGFEIYIFNRWGEKVYYSTDINEGWDGQFKGDFAQQDVYTYVVNVTSFSGKPYSFYGTVTLLR
jgi:gliding motility-associated-like protein